MGVTDGDAAYLIFFDQLATPRALVDLAGNIVQTMQYAAFGNILAMRGDAVRLPLGFAGGLFGADTGLERSPSGANSPIRSRREVQPHAPRKGPKGARRDGSASTIR